MQPLPHAFRLAAAGYPVFPIAASKRPTCPHSFKDAATEAGDIRRLWRDHPGPLLGVPTGKVTGLFVLDLDTTRHTAADEWFERHAPYLPETRQQTTRSGGLHLFFRHVDGLRNSAGRIALGVDTRAEGGSIIVWQPEAWLDRPRPLADAPQWLLEMAKPKPPRDPMNVVGLDPFAYDRPKQRGGGGAAHDARPRAVGAFSGGGPAARGPRTGAFTQFSVNWGEQTGATPSRLLSHVCRRGGLESHQVGSIQITAKSSTVDIASDAADAFEKSTRRPDSRDPEIMIRRDAKAKSPSVKPWAKPGTKPGAKGNAAAGSASPAGPAREPRRPNAKRPGRPVHLKRKNPRRTASR